MKEVSKKILPQYFEAVKRGVKTFEIRKDEDEIQVGDILILKEWEWETGKYTGRELKKEVAYVLRHIPQYGVQEGYFIISLKDFNNGWIPCSERLPEEVYKYYLVTYRECVGGETLDYVKIDYLSILPNNMKSWEIEEAKTNIRVLAWQPLPEPYKTEGE